MAIILMAGLAVNFVGLVIWIHLYSKKEIRYIDKSGVLNNPPTFIETLENKTLNFDYNGIIIYIGHLNLVDTFKYVAKISGLFQTLQINHANATNKAFEKINLKEEDILTIVDSISVTLYQLSKPYLSFWQRIGRKKWMIAKARNDVDFIIGLSGEIFDYWQNLGNAYALMMKGATKKMMYGVKSSTTIIDKDILGNRLIKPRHDSFSYISMMNRGSSDTKTKSPKPQTQRHSPEN